MNARESARAARAAAGPLSRTPRSLRDAALDAMSDALVADASALLAANADDLAAAKVGGVAAPLVARLSLDEAKIRGLSSGLASLRQLPDPLGRTLEKRELSPGLVLERISCSIGVVGIVFESRPDALVQIASLCLKSGNACLLKGGREALRTNRALTASLSAAAEKAGVPGGWMQLLETRDDVDAMLELDGDVDLVVPRGSNSFVRYVQEHTRIPVLGHSSGLCHLYLDESADAAMAAAIAVDAKTQAPATCNSIETLLVHAAAAARLLPPVAAALSAAGVELRGDEASRAIVPAMSPATDEDWDEEYLDRILSVKVVTSLEEAVRHINAHGSHHTDAIVASDAAAAEKFLAAVDSADAFWNCSTRFADGFRFGLGAELGIATGKIHARGPVGLDGLTTYKWILRGAGQTVAPFVDGRMSFTHREL